MIPRFRAVVPAPGRSLVPVPPKPPEDGDVPKPPRGRAALYVALPVLALLAWGAWGHWQTNAAADEIQQQQRDYTPQVRTAKAKRVDAPIELTTPGQTLAFDSANLLARATGYIAERRVDIGTRVHKGDLLLRIAAPDLDQQLLQAQAQLGQMQAALLQSEANLKQANANVGLANVTKQRTTTLASQGWETKQNADNTTATAAVDAASVTSAQAGIAVALANVRAQQATVERLQDMTGFERIVAPFDGVITARTVDTGDLVTADSAGGTPLLSIARDDVIRVSVYVPQSGAGSVREGLAAKVTVPELPGRIFDAKVSRTAHALDATSRSMLTEVDIDNTDGTLRPGQYAQVTFEIPRQRPGVVVPDEALVFNADGLHVLTVADDDSVHFQKVAIYRDFGTTAELQDGLQGDETLVLAPPPDLMDGGKIRVATPPPGDPAKPSTGQQTAKADG
jgi:RND family efflux transporter MFP subunit